MSEKLTPLEIFYEMKHYLSLEWSDVEDLDIVEKSLKALEIIKNKKVNVSYLFSREVNDYIDYNVWSGAENLTPEEYELLKEVLK